ncbi:sterol desaturase family protein, partial [Alishewanella sp. SMS9]|nr:sterol desaturase family protein [Alishewanella sp. SMS9]
YWQHRLFHRIPLLWRLHQVHHADPHIDSTSGLRFHPLEILLSYFIKLLLVFLLGVPALAVLLFEIILNASAIFNHSNIRLPAMIERPLRWFIVTQQMHRIHHSQRVVETNSNYGFNLSVWDRLFGSYCEKARKSDAQLDIGLVQYLKPEQNTGLAFLLSLPFRLVKDTTRNDKPVKR